MYFTFLRSIKHKLKFFGLSFCVIQSIKIVKDDENA
jgi:hypothetical protein